MKTTITNKQRIAFIRHLSVGVIRRIIPMAFEAAATRCKGEHQAELIRHANIMRQLPHDDYAAYDPIDAAYPLSVHAALAADAALAAADAARAAAHAIAHAADDAARAADAAAYTYAADAYAARNVADAAARAARATLAAADADARTAHHVRDEYAACLLEAADACLPLGAIPINTAIDQRVYQFVTDECKGLDMDDWHGDGNPENWCGTTHCRAGAAIACQGKQGIELERAFGSAVAGALIYAASYRAAGKPITIPDFYASNDEAMEDMKRLAES